MSVVSEDGACQHVMELAQKSIQYAARSDFSSGYDAAQNAMSAMDHCGGQASPLDYDQQQAAAAGMTLGARALNEMHLPQGDSHSDARLARALLARCANGEDSDMADGCRGAAQLLAQTFSV